MIRLPVKSNCFRRMASSSLHASNSKSQSPSQEQIDRVADRVKQVQDRIDEACKQAKRSDRPRLVAISKLHPPSSIYAAHKYANQQHFGENYAQELVAKAAVLPSSIKWHFVGKLQSNKAKSLAAIHNLFVVETVDSIKLANALDKARAAVADSSELNVFLQVNTSGEENKGGLDPLKDDQDNHAQAHVTELAKHVISECSHLRLRGLMTIGAASNSRQDFEGLDDGKESDAEQVAQHARKANPDFAVLYHTRHHLIKALREALGSSVSENVKRRYNELLSSSNDDHPSGGLELSMGMSADLEVAICAGSNNVRVGTDCFGIRAPSRDEAMKAMKHELET